jgi:alpha-tubulin suppressor-like RCC1 family protein
MLGGVLYTLLSAAKAAERTGQLYQVSNYALVVFFGLMFLGSVAGVGRANANRQFLSIDYPSTAVRFNFDNALAVLSLMSEVLSLCAFVFQADIPWTKTGRASIGFRWFVFDFGISTFVLSFYVMMGTVLVFFVVVTTILVLFHYVKMSLVEIGKYNVVNIGFPLLAETVFVPVITVMMRSVTCSKVADGSGRMTLDADQTIFCWTTDAHRFYAGFALVALMSYFPTALFMGTRLSAISDGAFAGEKLDIKYKPIFFLYATFVKCVMAGVATFFVRFRFPFLGIMLAGNVLLFALNQYWKPCSVLVVNKARSLIYLASTWTTIAAFAAVEINDPTSYLSIIIWLSGLGIILFGIVIAIATHKGHDSVIEVYSMGQGGHGELGLGATRSIHHPIRNGNLSELTVVRLICHEQMSFAITDTHQVFCWGKGDLFTVRCEAEGILEPVEATLLSAKNVTNIFFGTKIAFAVSESGQLFYWTARVPSDVTMVDGLWEGSELGQAHPINRVGPASPNNSNTLGTPTPSTSSGGGGGRRKSTTAKPLDPQFMEIYYIPKCDQPVPVPGEVSGLSVARVKCTPTNSCFILTTAGQILVFGNNKSNLFGPNVPSVLKEAEFMPGLSEHDVFVDFSVSADRVFATTSHGVLWVWGSGRFGLLGNGACSDVYDPTPAQFFLVNQLRVLSAFSNEYYATALTQDGRVFMWGRYDPIEAVTNSFSPSRPLPARREETNDVWPTEVLALSGLPVIAIYPECPQCLIVMINDFSIYRIVHKGVVSDPRKAVMLWESAHAASTLMQNLGATGDKAKAKGKSAKSETASMLRKQNALRFRNVTFTAESYLVARRLLGGVPVTSVVATPHLVAVSQTRFIDPHIQLKASYIKILFFKREQFDYDKVDILTHDEPLVEEKEYIMMGISKVKALSAGRAHISGLCVR